MTAAPMVLQQDPPRAPGDAPPPGVVVDVELSEPVPRIPGHDARGRRGERAWVVVRLFTEPLDLMVLELPEDGLEPAVVIAGAVARRHDELAVRLAPLGLTPAALGAGGLPTHAVPGFLAERRSVVAAAPHFTVVVCTRERPGDLRRCLHSLAGQRYPAFSVLVVDNAPRSDATRRVVEHSTWPMEVTYTVEPRAGLSVARNHALRLLDGGLVAWLDDDEMADAHWLAELARGFHRHPVAAAVSGAVVPAELESRAQVWFEQFGGHSKGRGFTAAVFSPATADRQSPLYPLPPFGVGANMAFRVAALHAVGGFDEALGAGTPAKGGEDTAVFTRLLRSGATTVYQPSAVTRHVHRRDVAGLRAQMHGYGAGLTAFYIALVFDDPRVVWSLLRLLPRAWRDLTRSDSPRAATIGDDFPPELLRANLRGMLSGPWRYLRGRMAARRHTRAGGGA